MKINNNELIAEEGMVLTNGECYSTYVILGIYDSPSNWHEVSIEEVQNGEFAENNLFN